MHEVSTRVSPPTLWYDIMLHFSSLMTKKLLKKNVGQKRKGGKKYNWINNIHLVFLLTLDRKA